MVPAWQCVHVAISHWRAVSAPIRLAADTMTNHPNKKTLSTFGNAVLTGVKPTAAQVKKMREAVQLTLNIGITDAQDWCADALHTSRRSFQQWESGERAMHAAFWELLKIKTALIAHKP